MPDNHIDIDIDMDIWRLPQKQDILLFNAKYPTD